MNPAILLDDVTDWQSFAAFVRALAAEREQAEQLEKERPAYYKLGGALDWQTVKSAIFLNAPWPALRAMRIENQSLMRPPGDF